MLKFHPPRKKTPEEIREWLFNDLMAQIEPDLARENRGRTVHMLSQFSPDDLKKRMERYESAFLKFVERWPEYVKRVERDLKKTMQGMQDTAKGFDDSAVQDIESQISSLGDE